MGEHMPAAEPTRRRRAMPGAAVRSPLDDEVLAGMLRIGYMTASQIGRLWLPRAHRSTVNRLLARLCDDGLIAFAEYAVKAPETAGGGPPRYVGHVYVVTPRGEERVKAIFPEQPLEKGEQRLIQRDRVDNPQLAHALRYSEVLIRILEALPAMPNLIGVISSSEVLLSARKYPRADGIVLLRREKEPGARVSYVPAQRMEWLRRPWDRAQEDQGEGRSLPGGKRQPLVARTGHALPDAALDRAEPPAPGAGAERLGRCVARRCGVGHDLGRA
jgi:hypothetical protein